MATVGPPKFKAFTKTKVVLAIEPTPQPIDDLTSVVPTPFRDAANQGPDAGLQGPGADEVLAVGPEAPAPEMFGKKKRKDKKQAASAVPGMPGALSEFPGITARKKKPAKKVPGGPRVYSRLDVVSRELQEAEVEKLPEDLQEISRGLLAIETTNPYQVEPAPEVFVPLSRRGFGSFMIDQYGPIFPTAAERKLDVATCAAKGEEGAKEVKIYHYQAFIREYLRFETPYRGLLVYHGLGSGKTCSAIAAAEALFGTRGLKVIVMTPFSLRDNFISEISFCGFKHFRLQNHWTPLSLAPGSSPDPEMVKMFAKNVYGVPESFFLPHGRGRVQVARFWIPDFDKKPNFDSLDPEERDEIQTQLKLTIDNRIRFINYNGISARELKTMVCSTPDAFDNAVIVVDEIHNLTRLIQGSLEGYFSNPPGRRRARPLEKLTPERAKLPYCGMANPYLRGYLFYRLFMDAKNTKIVGLSGTPLINFPEELGILMNILHGPIQTIEFSVTVEPMQDVKKIIEKVVEANENLDTVHFQASEGSMMVTVTRLPEQFTKVFDEEELMGIRRRDPGQMPPTLEQIWLSLQGALKAEKITVRTKPALAAQELLPSWDTPFRGAFLEGDGITIKNQSVLQNRIRGLVSYYKGIGGDVMPKVIKDEMVGVPLTGYALKMYNQYRNKEIQVEMSKPKGQETGDVWAEINEIATMASSSNYRMSSRQACNFVFPESVMRPRPRNLEEQDAETGKDRDVILDADMEGKVAGREDAAEEAAAEAEEAQTKVVIATEEAGEFTAPKPALMGTKEQAEAYKRAIKAVKEKLREMGPTHLQLNGSQTYNLARYSPKFAAMLKKIMELGGSSLVYSQFLEMEGIGIFGICMEANGFVPIEILQGADGRLKFSDRTAASLLKGPKAKEMRYIEFTGVGSKEQRGAAVNVFNARSDKLPPAMQKVLADGGWKDNFDGGLCRVFCITSAGAEGLSLKCVRGVHIMEPYWNTVRTQQVKGRAVRICSHMELPASQQNVEIYTYCTIIPEEAILAQAVDKTLERSDTYSAKDAAALGVPVPPPANMDAAIPAGMFLAVEDVPEPEVAPGAQATTDGPIRFFAKLDNEYRGFSNFAPTPIVIDGKRYATVEHYFQSMKFVSNPEWQEAIRVSVTPMKAKQLGTSKEHPIRADWETARETVMLEGLRAKFKQNAGLLEQLKATGSRPLIEASVGDAYWGEGRNGKGKNRMGKLLEQVREELREFIPPVTADTGMPVAAPKQIPVAPEGFFQIEEGLEEPEAEDEQALAPLVGGAPTNAEDRSIILTSDQKVLLISLRKEKVIGSLQTIMKSVAVDCQMNFPDNNDGSFRCLSLGDSVGDFAYHPNLQKDIQETEARFKKPAGTVVPKVAPPTQVLALPVAEPKPAPVPLEQKLEPIPESDDDAIDPFGPPPPLADNAEIEQIKKLKNQGMGHKEAVATVIKLPSLEAKAEPVVEPKAEAAPKPTPKKIVLKKPTVAAVAVAPAPMPTPMPAPIPEPPKPKPKRIQLGKEKTEYYYEPKLDTQNRPLGYTLFAMTDPELRSPIGFIAADPVTKMPKGKIQPI